MGNLTKNFSLEEFYVSATYPKIAKDMARTPSDKIKAFYLCQTILEPIRGFTAKPITINSGKRDKALNEAVGGVESSAHRWIKYSIGVDFKIVGASKEEYIAVYEFAKDSLQFSIGEMILYFLKNGDIKHFHVTMADGIDQGQFFGNQDGHTFLL